MTRIALAQITSSTEKTTNLELAKQLITDGKEHRCSNDRFPGVSHGFLSQHAVR